MNPDRTIQLERWLNIDATSGRETAQLQALETDLGAEGFSVARHPVPGCDPLLRWNILATRKSADVVMCTHVDTVPPFLPVKRTEDALWGRGACDTKGVLLAMFEAVNRLTSAEADRVAFLLVVGEETDHCGAAAAREMALRPTQIILGEPTRGRVATGQKGILKVALNAQGVAGHSAFPETGSSAIQKLLSALGRIEAHAWPSDPDIGTTTYNIGFIEGGVASNVFAPEASAEVMFRAVSETSDLFSTVVELCGEDAEAAVVSHAEPQRFNPPAGFETCVVPFNSDAAWLRHLGPVWLAGPGDIRLAHSVKEHITFDDLDEGAQLYARLIRQALGS